MENAHGYVSTLDRSPTSTKQSWTILDCPTGEKNVSNRERLICERDRVCWIMLLRVTRPGNYVELHEIEACESASWRSRKVSPFFSREPQEKENAERFWKTFVLEEANVRSIIRCAINGTLGRLIIFKTGVGCSTGGSVLINAFASSGNYSYFQNIDIRCWSLAIIPSRFRGNLDDQAAINCSITYWLYLTTW